MNGIRLMAPIGVLCLAAAPAAAAPAAPDGWQTFCVREDLAPRFWVAREGAGYALGLAGRGEESVDGRWQQHVPVAPGKHYAFTAECRMAKVEAPARSALARVVWFDAQGKQLGHAEYPLTSPDARAGGWQAVSGCYPAPEGAATALLELHLRWAPKGEVLWRNIALKEAAAPTPRRVRLAAVNHRPKNSASPRANLEAYAALVDEAARGKADIVCLPEGITVVGTGKKYAEVAEPIPGPATRFLGECAARNRVYVVAGLYEWDGKTLYNTSVLLGRDGRLVGRYRKVALPREEIDAGVTPGKEYPVFDTDFGRVAMMICWDVSYPEVARELAARGAEVVFLPIWGGNETLARARAIENQVYLVASGYDFKTAIYDQAGEPVALSAKDPEVVQVEVDLNARRMWPWLGDWRARVFREGPARGGGK